MYADGEMRCIPLFRNMYVCMYLLLYGHGRWEIPMMHDEDKWNLFFLAEGRGECERAKLEQVSVATVYCTGI